jgi:hypothetical protein
MEDLASSIPIDDVYFCNRNMTVKDISRQVLISRFQKKPQNNPSHSPETEPKIRVLHDDYISGSLLQGDI